MKRITLTLVSLLIVTVTITAQPPQAFKYKAIARDKYGRLIINRQVAMRISLLQCSENGMAAYTETHLPFSNAYGVIELEIGRGKPVTGSFSTIDWGACDYYIKIEMDPRNKPKKEYTVIGTSQLLSVPYALFAGHVQNSQDNDGDPMNELITNAYLSGTMLTIIEGGNTMLIDLSGLQTGTGDQDNDPANELQNLSLRDHELSIAGGNTVILPDNTEDSDADPTNEIQDLKLEGNILTITNNGTASAIDLSVFMDNTDNQILSVSGQELSITGGNTVILPDNAEDADADPNNEIQALSLNDNVLTLTNRGEPYRIDLAPYLDNTDNQNLVIDGHLLTIANGNAVQLPDSVNDADHDPFNELQELALNGTELSISGSNTVDLAALQDGVIDDDADPTNELQLLRMSNDTIYLSEGGYVVLPVANSVNGYFCYGDKDKDGFGDRYKALWVPSNVTIPAGYLINSTDCDDNNQLVKPGVSDGCDGLDNDCDGTVDEECATPGCLDFIVEFLNCLDNNGCQLSDGNCNGICLSEILEVMGCIDDLCFYSLIANPEELPFDESWTVEEKANYFIQQCENPDADDDGFSSYEGDCDDTDAGIHPGAVEICGDGIDQDCNGHDALCGDNDGDGYTTETGDCNDSNPSIHPGAMEICDDMIDQDCDGGDVSCDDADEDGYTVAEGDCNDHDHRINPGAAELCDNIDNDCDLQIDEDAPETTWYRDADGDGYGNFEFQVESCIKPHGYVHNALDCNDEDPAIYADAHEICGDGIDQDCNGEDALCSGDNDNDGYVFSDDCNDGDPAIHPGATEICEDGIDQDCDGQIDEGLCNYGEMAYMDGFWIDIYEASLAGWTPGQNPGTFPAIAAAGVMPQVNITQVQAAAACEMAGKRLCTDAEWLRACQGPDGNIYPYGNIEEPGSCNGGQPNPAAVLMPAGENTSCLTFEGVYDMVGNAAEWTADPAGTFRGGYYTEAVINGVGCLYATTAHNTAHADEKTGFRCCANEPPAALIKAPSAF